MLCKICGHETEDGLRYCTKCGAQLLEDERNVAADDATPATPPKSLEERLREAKAPVAPIEKADMLPEGNTAPVGGRPNDSADHILQEAGDGSASLPLRPGPSPTSYSAPQAISEEEPEHRGGGMLIAVVLVGVVIAAAIFLVFPNLGGQSEQTDTSAEQASESAEPASSNMSVGETATLDNGLLVRVSQVDPHATNLDGAPMTRAFVEYVNGGTESASYNFLDWKAETQDGSSISATIYTGSNDRLGGGDLEPGASVSGYIFFDEVVSRIFYCNYSFIQKKSDICWNVG